MATVTGQRATLAQYYMPSEILKAYKNKLATDYYTNRQGQIRIYMQGIYVPDRGQVYQGYCYDWIRDSLCNEHIRLKVPIRLRAQLKVNSLINVAGVLEYSVQGAYSSIQLILEVTWAETVQVNAVTKEDVRRNELLMMKNNSKRRNVDTLLEGILYEDKRPSIGLIFAESAITETDFDKGLNAAAREKVQFIRMRCSFSRPNDLMMMLKQQDLKGYHAIALVRGGGGEKNWGALDNLDVLLTIVQMKTPVIAAIGHPDEKAFIKNLVDKEIDVPFALGTYFSNMVNGIIEQRAKSKAALVEEVKKQYEERLKVTQTQNAELLKSIDKINGSITDLTKKNTEYAQQVARDSSRIKELEDQIRHNPNWMVVVIFSIVSAAIAVFIFMQTHIIL